MTDKHDTTAIRSIKLPRHRLKSVAASLLRWSPSTKNAMPQHEQITIVCISDTHNTKPVLPSGDLLLHAGDLSNNGSFEEIQAQLHWLSAQPHSQKVVIAGNHEVLLDAQFMVAHPERDYPSNQERTLQDLDWGSIKYLCDESITLEFPAQASDNDGRRTLKIFGSPRTPQYGTSAFQYPRHDAVWTDHVPSDTDILLTHGPPYKHLDGALGVGCRDLALEVERVRPRLVVFGHIHVDYGQEDVTFNNLRKDYERIRASESGWMTVLVMVLRLVCMWLVPRGLRRHVSSTTLVNASVVGGEHHEYLNPPIVVKV